MVFETRHRPWPLPTTPWAMRMTWHDLLFAHWPMPPAQLAPLIPAPLELDLFEGQAWVAAVPFHTSGIAARRWPALPGLSAFPELNLRTYVRYGGKGGVYFLSLDAAHRIAVETARSTFGLPYSLARIQRRARGEETEYHSRRVDRRVAAAEFRAVYRPIGAPFLATPGSLEHWLTERYAMFTADGTRARIGEIHHAPWPLQPAEAEISLNTLAAGFGLTLPDCRPLLHFARRLDVVAWKMRAAEAESASV